MFSQDYKVTIIIFFYLKKVFCPLISGFGIVIIWLLILTWMRFIYSKYFQEMFILDLFIAIILGAENK